ncbi:MAG: LPXTG cell wall anchor domain-containing protein [Aeriscardovia sp.]|nr:LPXTG cell wall anchor domain-containing protein [Aeriscardovia sp.]
MSTTGTGVNTYNLVNETPNGNPFNSQMFNTVENVKSMSSLPLTGGAGVLTGVIAAVLLFGTAGIVLVVYKRKKSQQD